MKNFLLQFFTWWNGQTIGTRFYTWRKGERVGTDEFGNTYYRSKDDRRWVIYEGPVGATSIPPGWHGWIHHRTDTAPSEEDYSPQEWQKAHQQNLSGTAGAYHPPGSLAHSGKQPAANARYEPWSP